MNNLVKGTVFGLLLLSLLWLFGAENFKPSVENNGKRDAERERNKIDSSADTQFLNTEPLPPAIVELKSTSFQGACTQRLQFIVSSEASIVQAADFQQQFLQDERLRMLPICIAQPLWFESELLSCEDNWLGQGRLGCDLRSLGDKLKGSNFTHLVIFAEQGKANVHNGVMYLDREDTYDVFVHELAHFAGFVDEYPLSKGLASKVCDGQAAPNLIFQRLRHTEVDLSRWSSIDDDFGISVAKARTCDNHPAQAFKPSADITFMEFHDQAYIPPIYIAAWLKRLATPRALTPAYINFAQLYEQQNKWNRGKYWRQRYLDYIQGQ